MTRRFLRAALLLALALTAAGCSPGPLDPAVPLSVSVASDGALRLKNESSRPIYYLVFERNTAAVSLWGPCDRPDQPCPGVAAHSQARVPYSQVAGYQPGAREAIVYWWHLVEADGGWKVDEVRSVVVDL